jgi:predicted dehydrogenase
VPHASGGNFLEQGMVRAAIVGLGRWGRSLVASVQRKSDDIHFVAAHTRTRINAEDFCRQHDLAFADSYDAILQDRNIDAVVLATPHRAHEAQVLAAAKAGKHIFVEKPITLDRRSAGTAVAAAQKAGLVLAVGFTRRFHPCIGEVRARLNDGRLGTLVAMVGQHTTSTGQFIPTDNWRADPEEAPADDIIEHPTFDMLRAELTAFARSVRDKAPYPVPLDDVLHGMSVFDAAVRSARTGNIEKVNSE